MTSWFNFLIGCGVTVSLRSFAYRYPVIIWWQDCSFPVEWSWYSCWKSVDHNWPYMHGLFSGTLNFIPSICMSIFVLVSHCLDYVQFSSVTQSCLTLCDLMDCSPPTPRVFSNSCPSSQWCHPAISSSVVPFSSCLQSFPASGSFPMDQYFTSGGQILELQLQHQSFQWIFRTYFL